MSRIYDSRLMYFQFMNMKKLNKLGLAFLLGLSGFYFISQKADLGRTANPLIPERNIENILSENPSQTIPELEQIIKNIKVKTVLNTGSEGEWDENIREIGNVVFNPALDSYFLFYSGFSGDYQQDNVFVGMAQSNNGVNWKKSGKIIDSPSEDPYVVLDDGKFYIFYEDKSQDPPKTISLAVSENLNEWKIIPNVLKPSKKQWENKDVSSPLVFRNNGGWTMLYEGRGNDWKGRIGMAHSSDLIKWDKLENYLLEQSENQYASTVPDDILKLDTGYLLSYHHFKLGEGWINSLSFSSDISNWRRVNTTLPKNTSMIVNLDGNIRFMGQSTKGICISQ